MRIAREYITYLARDLAQHLAAEHWLTTSDAHGLQEAVHQALQEEFAVEDRINEEARTILATHTEEMQRLGATYSDSFKKIKAELVRKHKAVL